MLLHRKKSALILLTFPEPVSDLRDKPLQIGAVYEAFLTIWTKEVLHAFIEIVRIVKEDATYSYGGIFIGMPEMDAARIEVYDTVTSSVTQE